MISFLYNAVRACEGGGGTRNFHLVKIKTRGVDLPTGALDGEATIV